MTTELFKELDAIDTETIQRIRDLNKNKQCDVSTRGEYGETCLHLLCSPQHQDQIKQVIPLVLLLVDYGANVNAQDKEGNTALHVCTINESPLRLILTFFRLGADPTIENKYDCKPLDYAENDDIKGLLNKYSPGIVSAIRHSDEENVRQMVGDWFFLDITYEDKKLEKLIKKSEKSSLREHIKDQKKQSTFIHAVLCDKADEAKDLLNKVDVNACDRTYVKEDGSVRNWPLVAEALFYGNFKAVKAILKKVDVNKELETDSGEKLPFYVWVLNCIQDPDPKLLKNLFKKVDPSLYPGDRITQLFSFMHRGFPDQIIDCYAKHGYFLGVRDSDGLTLRDHILLHAYKNGRSCTKNHVSFVDNYIMRLVKEENLEKLKELLTSGYNDIIVRGDEGRSVIEIARESKKNKVLQLLEQAYTINAKVRSIHLAIENGNLQGVRRDMDTSLCQARDYGGRTPLHKAVLYERKFVIAYLLKTYPNIVNAVDVHGRTPLHYACFLEEDHGIENLLIKAGANQMAEDKHGKVPVYFKMNQYSSLFDERSREYGKHTYLLNLYLNLYDAINYGDEQVFDLIINNLSGIKLDELDTLPQHFEQLTYYKPLLFVCVHAAQEHMAKQLLMNGSSPHVTYTDNDMTQSIEEAAAEADMHDIVTIINKRIQQLNNINNNSNNNHVRWKKSINQMLPVHKSTWKGEASNSSVTLGSMQSGSISELGMNDSRLSCGSSRSSITPPPTKKSNCDNESSDDEKDLEVYCATNTADENRDCVTETQPNSKACVIL